MVLLRYARAMAKQRRDKTRAARRRAEKQRLNEQARERGVEAAEAEEDAKLRPRTARHMHELDRLLARGSITADQCRVGHRFAADFRRSGSVIGGRLISSYEANRPRPPKKYQTPAPDLPQVIEARERVELAIAALGRWLSPIVIHTCVADLPPSEWLATPAAANSEGAATLRLALAALVIHYSEPSSVTARVISAGRAPDELLGSSSPAAGAAVSLVAAVVA